MTSNLAPTQAALTAAPGPTWTRRRLALVAAVVALEAVVLEGLLLDELGRVDEARRWYAAALSLVELSPIRRRVEQLDVAAREGRPPPPVPRGLQTG